MRVSIKTLSATAATGLVAALAGAVPAHAASTLTVSPGQSIQAAIDKAQPGDTIVVQKGTYAESLDISTDDITLVGNGALLTEPSNPAQTLCNQMNGGTITGICVHGDITPPSTPTGQPTINSYRTGVTISGIAVRGFSEDGIFGFATDGLTVTQTNLQHNGQYGVFDLQSKNVKYTNNFAAYNGDAGLYFGESTGATITGNRSLNNGLGLLLRSAETGEVANNIFSGSCTGILLFKDPSAGTVGGFNIHDNIVNDNNAACAGDQEEGKPPLSGIGIGLAGAHDTVIKNNTVYSNRPSGQSAFSGGILVGAGPDGTVSSNDTVTGNTAQQNAPVDVGYDGKGTGDNFTGNTCGVGAGPGVSC